MIVFGFQCVLMQTCTLFNLDELSKLVDQIFSVLCPADVGRNVILTSGCIIGAFCQVNTCEVIPENTVIYGSECMRRVQTERPQVCIHAHKALWLELYFVPWSEAMKCRFSCRECSETILQQSCCQRDVTANTPTLSRAATAEPTQIYTTVYIYCA